MGRNTPNPNLTSLVNCRHILAGASDVHHAHGTIGQLSGQVCNEGIVLFQAGIGYGAVLQKGNVGMIRNGNFLNVALVLPRLLVFAFGNPFLVPAFQLVARGITPEVYIAFRVQNDAKLVASFQLFHLQRTSAQSSIQLRVALVLSLTQAVIAPEVEVVVCINCDRMVTASCKKFNIHTAISELCGNVLHVNDITDPGVTPRIKLTILAEAQTIGRSSNDVMDALRNQLRGDVHHEIARRNVSQRRI